MVFRQMHIRAKKQPVAKFPEWQRGCDFELHTNIGIQICIGAIDF